MNRTPYIDPKQREALNYQAPIIDVNAGTPAPAPKPKAAPAAPAKPKKATVKKPAQKAKK